MRTAAAWILLLALVAAPPALGATLHVPQDWPTIQSAVDVAAVGDTVLVAPGTYTDRETRIWNLGGGPLPLTACVFLRDGVVIASSGGSAVTTIDFGARDPSTPNAVVAGGVLSHAVTLRGFTLLAGDEEIGGLSVADMEIRVEDCVFLDFVMQQSSGAGFRCTRAKGTLRNCVFRGCIAGGGGGAIGAGGDLDVEGCLFESCGSQTGAISNSALFPPGINVRIVNSTFRGNYATLSGGAVSVGIATFSSGDILIEGNVFVENTAHETGGAIIAGTPNSLSVLSNVFVRNQVEVSWGAACALGGGFVLFEGNTLVDNIKNNATIGGAAAHFSAAAFTGLLSHNVVVGTIGGPALAKSSSSPMANTGCNVFWNNAGGDLENFQRKDTDRTLDPQFCDPGTDDYRVHASSPCLPENSPGTCGLIGALGMGCGSVSVEPQTWARTKALYR